MTPDDARKLDDAHRTAESARALVENPLLGELLDGIRSEALRAFEDSAPQDHEARSDAYHLLRAVRRLDAKVRGAVSGAEFAHRNMRSRLHQG